MNYFLKGYYSLTGIPQAVKDSILAVKYLVDSGKLKNITYILTGSSSVNIKKTGESLPARRGRGRDFHFHPVSFRDFATLQFPQIRGMLEGISTGNMEIKYHEIAGEINLGRLFDKYLVCGGVPRVFNEYLTQERIDSETFEIYRQWILSEIAKNNKKEHFCKVILERTFNSLTSDISYNSFAQDAGIGSHNTVYEYLEFLVNSFVLRQIFHYDYHTDRINYRKNKKIYFNDPFILWVVDKWLNARSVQRYEMMANDILKSRFVENAAFNELYRKYGDNLHYYRNAHEIDFANKNLLVEVKYQNRIVKSDYAPLLKIKGPARKVLISKNTLLADEDVLILPVELAMLVPEAWIGIGN